MRDVLAVLVGLVVLAAVVVTGWTYLSTSTDPVEPPPEPGGDAGATAEAYLAAWSSGDTETMASFLRGEVPEDFADRHRQLAAALQPTDLEVTGGDLATPRDGQAIVPVRVRLEVPGISTPVSWETELELLRSRGDWSVDWSLSTIHPELRPSWGFARTTQPVDREPILAVDGTPLAGGTGAVTFGFEPRSVTDPEAVIEAFAAAIPGSGAVAERELNRDDLVENWFYPVVTVSATRAELASSELRRSMGILTRSSDEARTLYDAGFARHVVGIVAEATAEQLAELEEQGEEAEVGTRVPQFGIEAALDEELTGSELVRIGLREQGEEDAPLEVVLAEEQADPSAPVETTLEVPVQQAIENALADVEQPAAIVAVDGSSGAVRGSASRPLGGFNRAFSGRYPPGSTFKVVTAEALIGSGIGPDDEVACPAETTVGGLRVPNAGGRDLGTTSFRSAFAASCNTTFATLGAGLGAQPLTEAAERFGFGVEPDVPLSAFGGAFPPPNDAAEVGAAAFGQARVEASPLHLASVAAATVDGVWYQPHLLVDDGPGESRALATGTPDVLRSLLRSAVTDGTGEAADVGGQEVAGKTGTAEAQGEATHAWFIGIVDGLGFAVLVEDGGSGSEVAAPLAGRFVEELAALRTAAAEASAGPEDGNAADTDDPGAEDDSAEDAGAEDGGADEADADEGSTEGATDAGADDQDAGDGG